jgi:hypothetical protein
MSTTTTEMTKKVEQVKVASGFAKRNANKKRIEDEEAELAELMKVKEEATEDNEQVDEGPEPKKAEEKTFKKRYGDLRRHAQKTEEKLQEQIDQLKAQLDASTKKEIKYPKSEDELTAWMERYPDVAKIVETIAMKKANETASEYENKFKEIDEMKLEARREKAEAELMRLHPDFEQIRDTDDFHNWVEEQPKWVQDALYDIMAFASAGGWTNLPNGNFSPVIYSKQAQLAFRKASTVAAITNSDYFGEIANMGDSVKIIKEPEISVSSYARGTAIAAQDIADADFTLVVDKANYFAFKMDDIEEAHSHVNFMQMATDRAAYRLRDQYDQEVLGYLSGYKQSALHSAADTVNDTVSGTKADATAGADELLAANKLDAEDFANGQVVADGDTIALRPRMPGQTSAFTGAGEASPLQVIARMARKMDLQNVDTTGRWIVVDPVFAELLKDEDSRVLNADFGGSGLQNGLVLNNLHGFKVYVSNNLPSVGTGASTTGGSNAGVNFGVIVAGHQSAVATAEQINKTETYRDPDSFADVVRGMHLYGRKILRPEAIVN